MKKLLSWSISAIILMLGLPWLIVTFAGDEGMSICFILFFAINPLFSIACGVSAGTSIKQLWALPIIAAGLFLAGAWLFFEIGETAFILYSACYLIISIISMLISALVNEQKRSDIK